MTASMLLRHSANLLKNLRVILKLIHSYLAKLDGRRATHELSASENPDFSAQLRRHLPHRFFRSLHHRLRHNENSFFFGSHRSQPIASSGTRVVICLVDREHAYRSVCQLLNFPRLFLKTAAAPLLWVVFSVKAACSGSTFKTNELTATVPWVQGHIDSDEWRS